MISGKQKKSKGISEVCHCCNNIANDEYESKYSQAVYGIRKFDIQSYDIPDIPHPPVLGYIIMSVFSTNWSLAGTERKWHIGMCALPGPLSLSVLPSTDVSNQWMAMRSLAAVCHPW